MAPTPGIFIKNETPRTQYLAPGGLLLKNYFICGTV